MRVLIIEDDAKILDYITKGFTDAGHTIESAVNGKDGLALASAGQYDVIIVDRMIPEPDGLTVIKTLRAAGNSTPALILSAKADVQDKVEGLRGGADDYLAKQFDFSELAARVDVLAARHSKCCGESQTVLTAADVTMNLLTRTVTRGGQEIPLQTREFKLLEYLLRNKGQTVTRTMLLESLWDYHFDPQTNVIDVHISRLRGKIDKGFSLKLIKTLRGAGYMLDDTPEPA